MSYPVVIQGGMGVAVSNWNLAKAVSQLGQLGVVSGTFLDGVLARRLQDGDIGGHIHRALSQFPIPEIASKIWNRYFIEGGKSNHQPYAAVPMHGIHPSTFGQELTILANFVEVFLAKEGHNGLVGINYLTKIELPTLPSLYGALLAGVDYVLMGAGIPKAIPKVLDQLSKFQKTFLRITVEGAQDEPVEISFDPRLFAPPTPRVLKRPKFIAIVSSSTLAQALIKKSDGCIDGFVVEHHSAGGHNAPPRGMLKTTADGEPIYGQKDECNLEDIRKLGLPFWLAGSYASPEKLSLAWSSGAKGIQVGTAFAFCKESGIRPDIKQSVINKALHKESRVATCAKASASGYPFKIVELENSISEHAIYENRPRLCDLGYLRTPYQKPDGSIGFRCPAEPVEDFVRKGGDKNDTIGKKCLCNGLISTVGYPQLQKNGYLEPPLITAGNELSRVVNAIAKENTSYDAADVLDYLLKTSS